MFDFHEKRKIRSFLYSKVVVGVLFLATFLLSISVYDRYTVASDMKEKLEQKRSSLDELKERAAALESKVEYLENERGIEEELRNRFDVAREGEQVIILLDAERGEKQNNEITPINPEPEPEKEKSFFDFLNI